MGTNASVQGGNKQVFKSVHLFPQTSLSAIHEPKMTLQGWSALCGQRLSCMQWSLSSVINVAKLKRPAAGSPFCPQMHVCGFRAPVGTGCA